MAVGASRGQNLSRRLCRSGFMRRGHPGTLRFRRFSHLSEGLDCGQFGPDGERGVLPGRKLYPGSLQRPNAVSLFQCGCVLLPVFARDADPSGQRDWPQWRYRLSDRRVPLGGESGPSGTVFAGHLGLRATDAHSKKRLRRAHEKFEPHGGQFGYLRDRKLEWWLLFQRGLHELTFRLGRDSSAPGNGQFLLPPDLGRGGHPPRDLPHAFGLPEPHCVQLGPDAASAERFGKPSGLRVRRLFGTDPRRRGERRSGSVHDCGRFEFVVLGCRFLLGLGLHSGGQSGFDSGRVF